MKAFFKYLFIQFKMDLRDRGLLLNYYLIPIIFFFVMGSVFSSINPLSKSTLCVVLTIFGVTMGAVMGAPVPLVKMRESGTLRAYKVSGIPAPAVLAVHALSAFIHLIIVSIIILLISPAVFNTDMAPNLPLYFGVLAVFLITNIGIGLLIGVAARNQSMATMFSMIVFLPSIMISGIMFPLKMLPEAVWNVARIFPATDAMQAFQGLVFGMQTQFDAGVSLGITAGIGIIAFALAIWRYNVNEV
ncbi:MAG: ABC transporter permease [Eubacteriales bacterium]